jgi:hypothetical protein
MKLALNKIIVMRSKAKVNKENNIIHRPDLSDLEALRFVFREENNVIIIICVLF